MSITTPTCGTCAHSRPDAFSPDLLRCHCAKSEYRGCTMEPSSKGCREWKKK